MGKKLHIINNAKINVHIIYEQSSHHPPWGKESFAVAKVSFKPH